MSAAVPVEHAGYADFPRGTVHYQVIGGHDVQVYVTAKTKKIRVHVDGKEWKPAS